MLSRTVIAARPLARALPSTLPRTALNQIRCASTTPPSSPAEDLAASDTGDPFMNGNYPNPPPGKRSLRDPYADWWDKQERRNFGEPLHEDNDIYAVFSTDTYSHFTPGWGAVLLGTFVASVFGLCAIIRPFYPDKPSVPRTFPGGLDRELGGKGAMLARSDGTDV
ncbi:hypothetical protein BJ546DRAFT_993260 [Cryomyces antarcticus]|uniref:NADH dehydrogenase [ubiquinone] 1 beta subcomplex subunit 8, mitochondrial n=1 Tax=Cryomyces antarcticus TaxID=329879 RepID=A0ABR0LZG3_9PEZI|nr:hypothetical protein LTR39_000642 [Cryomyces antarcticus]KAK5257248.1 hypothetical protein LTR16_001195 [Cryomyces antarcticus]